MKTKWAPAALRPAQARASLAKSGCQQTGVRPQITRNLFLLLILCFGLTNLHAQSIQYHGGWVVPSSHVYFIWYGNWNGDTGSIILPDLINGMNGSAYLNVLTSYTGKIFVTSSQNTFGPVTTTVSFGGQVWDWYSYGTSLSEDATKDLIQSHLAQFGTDPDGIYFLFTSADVDVFGPNGAEFCYQMCGYHNHTFRDNINMLHAVVGNPQRCTNLGVNTCGFPSSISPNGNLNADAMASTIAHEYAETMTDPNLDSWFSDATGQEMGDLCQGNYGSIFAAGNGAPANVALGSRDFLLQELWVSTGGCTLAFTPPPPSGGGGGGGGGGGCATQTLNPPVNGAQAPATSNNNPWGSTANNKQSNQPGTGRSYPTPKSSTGTASGITAAPPGQVRCVL